MQNEVAGWTNEAFMEDNRGRMAVFFHPVQRQNIFRSEKEKRPIFEEKIFLKKLVPGDNTLTIDRPMRETDIDEFPVEWARYQQKKESAPTGTPIEAWTVISETQKAEFKALNIFTIDQFANLADIAGNKIMGFNELRDKAKAFIDAAHNAELVDEMRAETDKKLQAQAVQIEELHNMIKELTATKKGRPKKELVE